MSTVTLALMPLLTISAASPVSSFSRTGMRCVTLTQLPVAFCAGSSENSAPVPAPMLSTVPWNDVSRIGVERDVGRLAGPQMGQLGFLEVRLDPGIAGLDEAEQWRAGGDELADLERRGLGDDAVGRRPHRGLRQIVGRLVARRLRGKHGRVLVGLDVGIAAAVRRARSRCPAWPRPVPAAPCRDRGGLRRARTSR